MIKNITSKTMPVAAIQQTDNAQIVSQGSVSINWELAKQRRELTEFSGSVSIKYLLAPEVHSVLEALEHKSRRNHFLINTLWHTGARISEALALTKSDFIFNETGNFVRCRTLKQKKDSSRLIPITDKNYIKEARLFIQDIKAAKQLLFPVGRGAVNLVLAQVGQELGIKSLSPHSLRHSFAVNAVMHGVPISVLKSWLGHSNITVTAIYTEIFAPDTASFMGAVKY